MRRPIASKFLVFLFALTTAACGSNAATIPVAPTPEPVTETFPGTIGRNGAATYVVTAQTSGAVTATLTTVGPDSSVALGLSLGTWNGTSCHIVLANDNALQGAVITGSAAAPGSLCVRVYDANGSLAGPTDYLVTVVHP